MSTWRANGVKMVPARGIASLRDTTINWLDLIPLPLILLTNWLDHLDHMSQMFKQKNYKKRKSFKKK